MNADSTSAAWAILLALLAIPASAADEKKAAGKSKITRAVPRLLVPPTASGFTHIAWWNGETLRGELDSADAATISWKSPLFTDPVKVKQEVIRRIDYGTGFQRAEGNFRLALTDGSHFTGELDKLDDKTITFISAACGPVTVQRDAVVAIERIGGEGITVAGPLAILPDKASSRANEGNVVTPLFLAAAGRAASPGFNLISNRPLADAKRRKRLLELDRIP